MLEARNPLGMGGRIFAKQERRHELNRSWLFGPITARAVRATSRPIRPYETSDQVNVRRDCMTTTHRTPVSLMILLRVL